MNNRNYNDKMVAAMTKQRGAMSINHSFPAVRGGDDRQILEDNYQGVADSTMSPPSPRPGSIVMNKKR